MLFDYMIKIPILILLISIWMIKQTLEFVVTNLLLGSVVHVSGYLEEIRDNSINPKRQ